MSASFWDINYKQTNAIMKAMTRAPTDPAVTREDPLAGGADVSTGGAVSVGELGTSEVVLGVSLGVGVGVGLGLLGTGTVSVDGGGSGGDSVGTSIVVSGVVSGGDGGGAAVVGGGGSAVGGVGLIIWPSEDWLIGMYDVVG